ncbi:MAG: response regulator transcription factor [Flavobacteriaceae bacterium]|nr:response regulator transcription factor [Flavobacteriaceae bacterium]
MNNSSLKILLVDDEPDILEIVGYNLTQERYTIFKASNGKEAISMAQKHQPHLILLDVMMPEMNGLEACVMLRTLSGLENVLIAFFTARNEEYSQLTGFDAGADDYITKPIKPKILVSKVKALLRRVSSANNKNTLSFGHLIINKERYQVSVHGTLIDFPKKEFELLALLASDSERIFTRHEILETVWGNEVIVGERTIDVHIRKIREKIGDNFVATIKGVGYRFITPNQHKDEV